MNRIQCRNRIAGALIGFVITLLFCPQIHSAESTHSKTNLRPGIRDPKVAKTPARRVNWTAVSPSNFTPDMTFEEALNILRNTTIPPLNIVVLWRNLEAVDIYRETLIGLDGVSGVPLRIHLKLLLISLSGGNTDKLGYVVRDGVIIISTQSSLPNRLSTRIYDITDLVAAPATGGLMPGMGMPMGLGGMPFGFGGMMPFGLGSMFGAMSPFGGSGYTGQGQQTYGNTGYR